MAFGNQTLCCYLYTGHDKVNGNNLLIKMTTMHNNIGFLISSIKYLTCWEKNSWYMMTNHTKV